MRKKQNVKDWIGTRKWVNPYWKKIANYPNRIFLEQDLYQDSSGLSAEIAKYKKIICEIGSGSGGHLIELARQNPDTAVIGFELRFKRVVRTIEKSETQEIKNTFVICGYAQNAIEFIDSTDEIYVNFPDPWEKKIKNRLVNAEFIKSLALKLKSDCIFNFKTDHKHYFEAVKALIQAEHELLFSTEDLHQAISNGQVENINTEFEELFLSQDLNIYALRAHLLRG